MPTMFEDSRDLCDPSSFRNAMANAISGVGIITTDGPFGRFGVTVSSMTSVSMQPPTLLVCIRSDSPCTVAIGANRSFCLNLLRADQAGVADVFAGRPCSGAPYDFGCASWSDRGEMPILDDAVASFHCRLASVTEAGSHSILVGLVADVREGTGRPLLYTARKYGVARTF